jgi:hypothetical protein
MVQMGIVTDPVEIAKAREQRARFDRNWEWFEAHCLEIYPKHRGKSLCISGEEVFVGDSAEEVLAQAKAAHPDDNGRFLYYVPRENVPRIYAHRR